jgi:outer membrane protein with beta-barrel domain
MKNCVCACVTAAIVLAASVSHAQTVQAGVKVGIDFSSLPNAGQVIDQVVKIASTETSSKTGVVLGGFVTFPIRDRLAFQPELSFVMKGVKLNEGSAGTVTTSLNYLEFPMLLRYALALDKQTGYVLVGPTFGVKASTSAKLDGPSQSTDYNIDPAIRTFDAGLAFAGGIEYGKFLFEVRYTQGLTDVGTDVYPHADSVKNRVFAIQAGIRLK